MIRRILAVAAVACLCAGTWADAALAKKGGGGGGGRGWGGGGHARFHAPGRGATVRAHAVGPRHVRGAIVQRHSRSPRVVGSDAAPAWTSKSKAHIKHAQLRQRGLHNHSSLTDGGFAKNAREERFADRQRWRFWKGMDPLQRHRFRGAFVGWWGPVFWPYAYYDIFGYAFWPYAYDDLFWFYAYDDLFDSIYAPHVYAAVDVPRSRSRRARARGPAVQVADGCDDRTQNLTSFPFENIERAVQPDERQHAALEALKAAAADAAIRVKASCSKELALTPTGRLDAMERRLKAMLDGIQMVRPALETFYGSLSDEQKERFNALDRGPREPVRTAPARRAPASDVANACQVPKGGLVDVPVERIERVVVPTDAQRRELADLRNAAGRAVDILKANCPDRVPPTPVERLAAMQQRLDAMVQALDAVRPELAEFYGSLNDEQKARFNQMAEESRGRR